MLFSVRGGEFDWFCLCFQFFSSAGNGVFDVQKSPSVTFW